MSLNETKIVIRSVFKITKCKMNPAIDPKTGRFPDHVRRVNSDGDIIYKDGEISEKKSEVVSLVISIKDGADGKEIVVRGNKDPMFIHKDDVLEIQG